MKAVVRYLRYNKGRIPGDVERIITNGTSAGGALSALTGASGNSPENSEFGTKDVNARHFTAFSHKHSEAGGEMADVDIIRMMNSIEYIGKADTAKHWRIRHGVFDRDTSLAIPVILAVLLENKGYDVDFFLPWGLPHSGDYDLEELFAWIDGICKSE